MSFYVCFSCSLCFYDPNDGYYAIFLKFGDVEGYGWWVWVWSSELESWKFEFKVTCFICRDFGMNYVYKVLDDLLSSFMMLWMPFLIDHNLGFYDHAWFS